MQNECIFFRTNGCIALVKQTKCTGHQCPFYKTLKQQVEQLNYCADRLEKLGRRNAAQQNRELIAGVEKQ